MRAPCHRIGASLAAAAAAVLAPSVQAAIAVPAPGPHLVAELERMFSPQVFAFLAEEKIPLAVHDATFDDLAGIISRRFILTGPRFQVVGDGSRRIEDFSSEGNILAGLMSLLALYPGACIETHDGGRGLVILHIPAGAPLD